MPSDSLSAVERADLFWSAFAIDGEWVEYHPTLREMVQSADLVALASLSELKVRKIQHGTSEEVVTEGRLTLTLDEVLRGEDGSASVILTLVSAYNLSENSVAKLNSLLPLENLLVLLRERQSESGVYNLINSFGLWARTGRADVDCPITRELVDGVCFYRDELSDLQSVAELADQLRP